MYGYLDTFISSRSGQSLPCATRGSLRLVIFLQFSLPACLKQRRLLSCFCLSSSVDCHCSLLPPRLGLATAQCALCWSDLHSVLGRPCEPGSWVYGFLCVPAPLPCGNLPSICAWSWEGLCCCSSKKKHCFLYYSFPAWYWYGSPGFSFAPQW